MSPPKIVPHSSVHERPVRYLRSVAHDVVLGSHPKCGNIYVSKNRVSWEEWQIVPVGGALSIAGDSHIIMLKSHGHHEQYLACSKDHGLKMICDVTGTAHAALWTLSRTSQHESTSQFCLASVATGQLLSCPDAKHGGGVKMVAPPTAQDAGIEEADPYTVWAWYPDVSGDGSKDDRHDGGRLSRTHWEGFDDKRVMHASPKTMRVVQDSSFCLSPAFSRVFLRPQKNTSKVLTCHPTREAGVQLSDLTGARVPAQEWVIEVPTGFFDGGLMVGNSSARKPLASVPIRIRSNESYRFFMSRVDSESDKNSEPVVVVSEWPSLWFLDRATLLKDTRGAVTGFNDFYIRSRSSNPTLHGRYLYLPEPGANLHLSTGAVDATAGIVDTAGTRGNEMAEKASGLSKGDKAKYVWTIDPVVPQVTGLLGGNVSDESPVLFDEKDRSAVSIGTSESSWVKTDEWAVDAVDDDEIANPNSVMTVMGTSLYNGDSDREV
eukprot:CAMPEP_0194479194 /NCGR_PEP_ID=MMETSP0253-20130528/2391_1 /TAXON_ID=2966 /ORGANISM="Noctiluca scintillans" /LENGTH=490 /DNA_ID=CAMNT_0039318377 /DNA_START=58 /DNA_END=1531 /DNA_ORIENTATION=-